MAPLIWGSPSPEVRQLIRDKSVPLVKRLYQSFLRYPLSPLIIPLLYLLAPGYLLMYSSTSQLIDFLRTTKIDPNFRNPNHYETFEFIVIGGGSAGACVASALSRHSRVLLLEAGGDPNPLAAVPVASPILLNQPTIDWMYASVPQQNSSFAFQDNIIPFPRGKTLGGSSVLNSMIYQRGNPLDYKKWAGISGDDDWSFPHVLPFFKKLENYNGHFPNYKYHGNGGSVYVEKARFTRGVNEWLKAGQELGMKVRDQNGEDQSEGFSYLDVTMKKGTRFDTHRAYIKPIKGRKNLVIRRYARAFKIHLDRQRNAYGVSYFSYGAQKFARANKEVIVSGGAISSPHLLMLSGIGRKKHLNSKKIKCRVHLPGVGENFHDHVVVNVGPITINETLSLISDRDVSIQSVLDFFLQGTGPLVSITGISSVALLSSSFTSKSWPDLLLFQIGAGVHQSLGADQEKSLNFRPGILQKFYKPHIGRDANFVTVMLGKPRSRGRITLVDNYPYTKPLLDPKYLSHPDDAEILLQGIKFVVKLYSTTKTYQRIGARFPSNHFPGCENHILMSDEYWRCYIRMNTFTLHHQCGTCRMGKSSRDPNAVVDSKLRVLKTRGLRVIDASIVPEITNANLNIPSIMIGERGSYFVREHWATQFLICSKLDHFIDAAEHEKKCFYSQLI